MSNDRWEAGAVPIRYPDPSIRVLDPGTERTVRRERCTALRLAVTPPAPQVVSTGPGWR